MEKEECYTVYALSTMFNSHAMVHMYSDSKFLILHLIQKHVVPKLIQP